MTLDEHQEGRRAMQADGKKIPKWPFILVAAFVSALLLGYFALCGYVAGSGKILPNTTVRGVEIGGLTMSEAGTRLRGSDLSGGRGTGAAFQCGERLYAIPASGFGLRDADTVAADAYRLGRSGGFLSGGVALLRAQFDGQMLDAPLAFNAEGLRVLNDAIADLGHLVADPVVEHRYQIEGDELVVFKGTRGYSIDRAALERDLLAAFEEGRTTPLSVNPSVTEPRPLDFAAIAESVFVAPADAHLDSETHEIVPGVVGISLDPAHVAALFDAAGDGTRFTTRLVHTDPAVTTERLTELLFADVLGEYTSSVGGTNNRASNVDLASQACDGIILLPGDVFSYNTATGSRTAAKGYLPAPAYVNGLSVDEIGGGICQVSSTIYAAALRANVKIVERANHMYAVGYVPDGQDATVYFGSLDFRFENNTPYPIKIVSVMENRRLTVQLLGTRTDNLYIVMEGKTTSSTPYKTVYRPDESIAPGTTYESITPYTGRRVEAYRCIYDNNGTPDNKSDDILISRTLESVNNYRHRDQVFLFNPADAAQLGVDPGTGQPIEPPVDQPPAEGEPPAEGQEPTGQEPTGEEPTGQEPTGEEPTGQEPTGQEPTGEEPTGQEPPPEPTQSEPPAETEPPVETEPPAETTPASGEPENPVLPPMPTPAP